MATKKATSGVETAAAVAKSNEDLSRKYFETMRKVYADSQKQFETATRKLVFLPQTIQDKSKQEAADLLTKYIDALKSASGQPNALIRIEEAWRDYVIGLQNLQLSVQKVVDETVREYQEAMQDIPQTARASIQEAYVDYLGQMKEILAGIDLETAEAEAVASVGRSMLAVSLYTKVGLTS